MVCILAERCARAEHIAEIERSRRFGGGESDDHSPVSEEWLVSVGAKQQTDGRWMFHHDTWPIFLSRSNGSPNVWVAYIDDSYFPIDIHSREQVRGLIRNCQEI